MESIKIGPDGLGPGFRSQTTPTIAPKSCPSTSRTAVDVSYAV
jgi:hypothetical protein